MRFEINKDLLAEKIIAPYPINETTCNTLCIYNSDMHAALTHEKRACILFSRSVYRKSTMSKDCIRDETCKEVFKIIPSNEIK